MLPTSKETCETTLPVFFFAVVGVAGHMDTRATTKDLGCWNHRPDDGNPAFVTCCRILVAYSIPETEPPVCFQTVGIWRFFQHVPIQRKTFVKNKLKGIVSAFHSKKSFVLCFVCSMHLQVIWKTNALFKDSLTRKMVWESMIFMPQATLPMATTSPWQNPHSVWGEVMERFATKDLW